MRYWDWFADGRLAVTDIGLACCVVEFEAATLGRRALSEPPPEARLVIVISGTVTDAAAPLVRAIVDAQPRRPTIIAFGACACAGGPYWDSPVVTKGADTILPVDLYLPGCPPPPGTLTDALAELLAA